MSRLIFCLIFLGFFSGYSQASNQKEVNKISKSDLKIKDKSLFLDRRTGLSWKILFNPKKRVYWFGGISEAEKNCKKLKLGGYQDWRVPTIHELVTLIDYSKRTSPIKDLKDSYKTMIIDEYKDAQILYGNQFKNIDSLFISSTVTPYPQFLALNYLDGTISRFINLEKYLEKRKIGYLICTRGKLKENYFYSELVE